MLVTVARGKAGRLRLLGDEEPVSWRDVFRRNEDLLTGVVFSRLRFLSSASLQRVMALLVDPDQVETLGPLESIDFWPKLRKSSGRSWVEPDVLMRFGGAFVLVEVKPPFGGMQSIEQWRAEVEALLAEGVFGERDAPQILHFIALGNNRHPEGELNLKLVDVPDGVRVAVHCREWNEILRESPRLADESSGADRAVFLDWVDAFVLFGLIAGPGEDWQSLCRQCAATTLLVDSAWLEFASVREEPVGQRDRRANWEGLAQYSIGLELEISQWH